MRTLLQNELTLISGAGASNGGECNDGKGNNGWGNGGDDGINSPKVDGGFKEIGDSDGAFGIHGGGRTKCAR